jgi:hypothetical protein
VQPGEQLLLLSTAVTVVVQALLNQLLCTAHVGFACMHACMCACGHVLPPHRPCIACCLAWFLWHLISSRSLQHPPQLHKPYVVDTQSHRQPLYRALSMFLACLPCRCSWCLRRPPPATLRGAQQPP